MYDLVRIEKVKAAEGFPFVCSSCGEVQDKWDYLRVRLGDNPNSGCIHLECLLKIVGFTEQQISAAVFGFR